MATKKVTKLTPKEPETMGDFMADLATNLYPKHADDVLEMVNDECPAILREPFRIELKAPCRLLIFTLATNIIEKMVEGLLDTTYEKARAGVLKTVK